MSHAQDLKLRSRRTRRLAGAWVLGLGIFVGLLTLSMYGAHAASGHAQLWEFSVFFVISLLAGGIPGLIVGITPVRWDCGTCKTALACDNRWVCGYCGKRNTGRSLLSTCGKCLKPPPSYECPQCGSLTYFEPGFHAEHAARPTKRPRTDDSSGSSPAASDVRVSANAESKPVRDDFARERSAALHESNAGDGTTTPMASDVGPTLREKYENHVWMWRLLTVVCGLAYTFLTTGGVTSIEHFGWSYRPAWYLLAGGTGGLVAACWAFIRSATVILRWDCVACGMRLESNVPWVCGSCTRENRRKSFLRKCRHCKAEPKAFACYHCDHNTYFVQGERDVRTRARMIREPLPGETQEQAQERHAREVAEREQKKRLLELDTEIKKRELALEQLSRPQVATNPKAIRERQLREQLEAIEHGVTSITMSAAKRDELIAMIRNKKHSPEVETQLVNYIDTWYQNQHDNTRYSTLKS